MTLCKCGCGQEVPEGKQWINGGHAAKWRKTQRITVNSKDNNQEDIKTPLQTNTPKWKFWKWQVFKRYLKEKTVKFPNKLLTEQEIKDLKAKRISDNLTDEQKFLRFFGTLPKWTYNKPGRFAHRLAKWRNGDFIIKHVVFVDEDGENKQAFIPYNQELGFLFTETGFYDVPLKDTKTIFLDSKKFAPLVNRKNYKDEFEIPEDLANSLINIGIGYGQLSQFKDLINEIKKTFMLNLLAYVIVILAFLAVGYVMYADGQHYKAIAEALNNATMSR